MNYQYEPINLDELRQEYDRLQNEARDKDRNQYRSIKSGRDKFSSMKLDDLKMERPDEAAEICSRLPDVSDQASALRNVLRGRTAEWSIQKSIASQIESQTSRDNNRKLPGSMCEIQIGRWSTIVDQNEAENIRCSVARAISQDCKKITGRPITKTDIQMEVDAHRSSSLSSVATRDSQQVQIDFGGLKETVSIQEAEQIWSKLNHQFRPKG